MSYLVTKRMVRAKTTYNGLSVPSAIALTCPHCNDYLTYFCRNYARHIPSDTITFLGWCPACEEKVSFWMVNCRDYERAKIFMHPALSNGRVVMPGIEAVPERITENYLEALDTFRHNYFKATTSMIRASLEDIFKTLLDQGDVKDLACVLATLAQKINLTAKIEDIATSIHANSNLLPHFELDKMPNQHTAAALLDLLEFILMFVYVMPADAKRLQLELCELGRDSLPD
ncbi:MAG: hypothetical protein NUK65_00205 [Firmicutes bacterium]|nr:hypothetical protein [Bacillota bacterium]